jgi:Family of unknown function (DUF6527)
MMPVRAYEAKTDDDVRGNPGAYYFLHENADPDGRPCGIMHACPCGCERVSVLWFKATRHGGGPEWDVAGEWPNVTLSPSIGIDRQRAGGFHWHGWLRDGEFVSA